MPTILTINSGSSSLKACLFRDDGTRQDFRYTGLKNHDPAFALLMQDLQGQMPDKVGHRMVHGGPIACAVRLVDEAELARLHSIVHLAPLHLPGNLLGLELCRQYFDVPQYACFDTAFHQTMPELSWRFPIPQHYGLRRYGFHGLNYAYVASVLPELIGQIAYGKVIVAHLGSGASLCLMENLQSQDTTMGYTPAAGIPMGTRSGDLDPGVMLELAQQHDADSLRKVVFQQMGLLALSNGISNDMSVLLQHPHADAQFAVSYFCRQVSAAIGSLAAKAGGIDALVFTGGIGENSPEIRHRICQPLAFMGLQLEGGAKPIVVVKADEERMICSLCQQTAE